jgi:tetratricopeptide (TPR) repeat protein
LTSDPALLAVTYANLGAAYFKLGEDDQARRNFDASLRVNPNQASAWLGLGRVLSQTSHVPEALDAYQNALKLSPDLVEAQQAAEELQRAKK